jgi:hypothetical protein
MNRTMSWCLLGIFALPSTAFAARPVDDALRAALRCEGDPLDVVRSLAAAGNGRAAEGFIGYEIGEEMDTISGVALQRPLDVAGASTHNVVASLAGLYQGFNGIILAQFEGQHAGVVEQLNLEPGDNGNFVRAVPTGEADEVCPPTIELRPLQDGRFLLGCGWCNG